jgi:hypothetical protein
VKRKLICCIRMRAQYCSVYAYTFNNTHTYKSMRLDEVIRLLLHRWYRRPSCSRVLAEVQTILLNSNVEYGGLLCNARVDLVRCIC